MKKKNRILLLIIVLVLILIISILILNSQKSKQTATEDKNTSTTTYFEDSNIEKLSAMPEKERITFYFSKYIEHIENGNFEEAYNMLYSEFKNTYFKSLENFEEYIETKYPEIMAINYVSFQTEGPYYIISVKVEDIINEANFEQKFILREYDYNNFVLSFQAE